MKQKLSQIEKLELQLEEKRQGVSEQSIQFLRFMIEKFKKSQKILEEFFEKSLLLFGLFGKSYSLLS